ncbi:hypothetical protein DF185_13255 [Marinifilum breve]|uniref:Uncharacterized protein n=1 Tax=Marinifilum breve TaxID=2184082 RepID=A0A2V4A0F1_9BACT|nr:hypothetical protein [Marinifilum breve]PXY00860.1 hypothetical protein DF185_13255 [Marinifilum breve]
MGQSRSYNGGDANFIIFSSQSINIINDKHDEFVAFSPHFTAETQAELKTLFETASNIPSDNTYIDIQAKATENVNKELAASGKFFQRCKFDIEMGFPNDKKVWNQFGFNDYDNARKSGKLMYLFLTDFDMIANKYKEALTAEGWTEDTFSAILAHRDKLKGFMDEQSDCILKRNRATEERTIALNALYEKLAIYFKAARIMYEDDEDLLKWFRFPAPTPKATKEEAENTEVNEEVVNETEE